MGSVYCTNKWVNSWIPMSLIKCGQDTDDIPWRISTNHMISSEPFHMCSRIAQGYPCKPTVRQNQRKVSSHETMSYRFHYANGKIARCEESWSCTAEVDTSSCWWRIVESRGSWHWRWCLGIHLNAFQRGGNYSLSLEFDYSSDESVGIDDKGRFKYWSREMTVL